MAVQRFSPKRLGEERCIALSSASAEDFQQGGITGSNRFCPPRFSAVFVKKGRARAEGRNASGGGGRLQGPKPAGWIQVWKEEFRLNKKLKLFGLLALTLVLGAVAAWAALPTHHLSGTDPNDLPFVDIAGADQYNTITGDGTQTGSVSNPLAWIQILQINPDAKETVTIAPRTGKRFNEGAAANRIQLVVNNGTAGKVVVKGSNGDMPTATGDVYTLYHGGTVQMGGTLGVTENNALGQRWVGVQGSRAEGRAPVFMVEGTDKLQLGEGNDPANAPIFQPFFLIHDAAAATVGELRYVKLHADAIVANSPSEGLWLHDGLDQRSNAGTMAGGAALTDPDVFYSVQDRQDREFVQLIKQGKGTLFINGDSDQLAAQGEGMQLLPSSGGFAAYNGYRLVDGAHHYGGTKVEEGVVQVHAGNATVGGDYFRGSLGKMWITFQGSESVMSSPYDPAVFLLRSTLTPVAVINPDAHLYNPLYILNNAQVKVNRSQFFSDFNVAKDAMFYSNPYKLAGQDRVPQVAVTLDQNDSRAEGMLEGNFDLVLFSFTNPANSRPATGNDQNPAITHESMAVLHVTNPENKIYAQGETLVANGVLEIAGAKSIGGGNLTIGATGGNNLPDRGFQTPWVQTPAPNPQVFGGVATLAVTNSFMLENPTVGQPLGAVAVDDGKALTFKDIELQNTGLAENRSFRINPLAVRLGTNYPKVVIDNTEPFFTSFNDSRNLLSDKWRGTVVLGDTSNDVKYSFAGTKVRQTRIDVERGVLQLNAFPTKTADQEARKQDPYAHVYLWPKSTLSLAKDLNDFSPYLNVKVTRDSRIRVVLRSSDIVPTLDNARAKNAVFVADHIDYRGLGATDGDKDRRLVIEVDPTDLPNKSIPKGWVKLVYSLSGEAWENTHFLRNTSTGNKEDFKKVTVSWAGAADLPIKGVEVDVNQDQYTIYANFTEAISNPVVPGDKPSQPQPPKLEAPLTSSASTVKPGADVTFTLGKWTYDGKDVEVENVKWMLDGVDKTADVDKDGKLTVKAGANGTKLELKVTANVKGQADKMATLTSTVTVSDGSTPPSDTKSSGGGGCDAGFGVLGLALAAAFLLKRKA